MLEALIFDLDGTVANTIPAIREGINLTMKELGYPEYTDKDVMGFVNFGARRLIELALPKPFRDDAETVDKTLSLYDSNYRKVYMHTDKTYDGIVPMVAKLKKDFKLALLSNKQDEMVKGLVKQLFPEDTFIVARGLVDGYPAKPDKTVPLMIADIMGVAPENCAFIGDSDVDVKTALNSGMRAIDVSWGYRSREVLKDAGAEYIASTPEELYSILREIKDR